MKPLIPSETEVHPPQHHVKTNRIWPLLTRKLENELSKNEFETWIIPIDADETEEGTIKINVPNGVFHEGIKTGYLDKIQAAKNNLGFDDYQIELNVFAEKPNKLKESSLSFSTQASLQDKEAPTNDETSHFTQTINKGLSSTEPSYTFENFVKGPSNQFAFATCRNVAEHPGQNYNPLFIYGHTGLGKTHLMHAVGNKVKELYPDKVVTYIRSENFMNEMIHCIRHDKMWDFRKKYRSCDVFLVDDIQFISSKKSTQEEFFHTFNALYETKKQIIVTSDVYPQDIPDIEERLRNRFQWGLISDIQPPDATHRIAILLQKAEKMKINLSMDIAEYIANYAKKNIRELEGALHRIHAFASLHGRPLTLDLAVEIFQNVLGGAPKHLTIETIQKCVAEHFKLKVSDLKSKKRQRALTLPRQLAMYLSRNLTKSSFPEIGAKFGGKDHTTVMHAVKKINELKIKDLDIKAHIDALERQLEQQSQ